MNIRTLINLIILDIKINFGLSWDSIRAILLLLEVRWEQFVYENCFRKNRLLKPIWFFTRALGSIYQFYLCHSNIPGLARIGRGIRFPHPQNIIIGYTANIGEFCTIYHNTTIAHNGFDPLIMGLPKIGDRVLLGTNSIIIGNIKIGSNVLIGAGTVLTKSVDDYSRVTGPKSIISEWSPTNIVALPGSKEHIKDPYSIWRKN